MQREIMLGAVLGARAPIADHALPERNERIGRRLRRIVIDAHAAEQRRQIKGAGERLIDAALKGPTRNFRHR